MENGVRLKGQNNKHLIIVCIFFCSIFFLTGCRTVQTIKDNNKLINDNKADLVQACEKIYGEAVEVYDIQTIRSGTDAIAKYAPPLKYLKVAAKIDDKELRLRYDTESGNLYYFAGDEIAENMKQCFEQNTGIFIDNVAVRFYKNDVQSVGYVEAGEHVDFQELSKQKGLEPSVHNYEILAVVLCNKVPKEEHIKDILEQLYSNNVTYRIMISFVQVKSNRQNETKRFDIDVWSDYIRALEKNQEENQVLDVRDYRISVPFTDIDKIEAFDNSFLSNKKQYKCYLMDVEKCLRNETIESK